MRKLLFVVPDLGFTGVAKQVTVLALGLPRERFAIQVCVLGRAAPGAERLRAAGVSVDVLGWRQGLDLGGLQRLRRLVTQFRPDMIHTWRPWAVRALALANVRSGLPLVVSRPVPIRTQGLGLSWLDRWLLGRVNRVVAAGHAEAARCRQMGVGDDRIRIVPPGVAPPTGSETEPVWSALPEDTRRIVCVGPLEPYKGFRDAIWAFDIVRRSYPDLHLVFLGTGSDQARLQQFAGSLQITERVHFAGGLDDLTGVLARAEIAWVPSRVESGVQSALDAMAAGVPVVASRLGGLAEMVDEGVTGFLIPPGDKVALARHTRLLLENPERRRQMGQAARQHVRRHFPAENLVRRLAALYDDLAA